MDAFANILVLAIVVYALFGLVFAVPFVLRGVHRIDPSSREGTWGFRLIIVPGVAALWPLLARRWWRGQGPPGEDDPHRRAARRGPA